MFKIITSVFVSLMFRLMVLAISERRLVFTCICSGVCDNRAMSSAKSRSSRTVSMFHRIPLLLSLVVLLITQSMTILKRIADITQPCLTSVFIWNMMLLFFTLHAKLLWKLFMMLTILSGIPYALNIFQRLSLWMLSKASWKSTKFMYNCLCHSVHCSMMLRSAKICSM